MLLNFVHWDHFVWLVYYIFFYLLTIWILLINSEMIAILLRFSTVHNCYLTNVMPYNDDACYLFVSTDSFFDIFLDCFNSICLSTGSPGAFNLLERAFSLTNLVADSVIFSTRFSNVSCISTSANFSLDAFKSFIKTATRTFSNTKCVASTNVVK